MTNPLDNIRIVLVSPLYGGNVGSVCRAMANMGLSDLAIAAPREHMDMAEARMMACSAVNLLEARKEFPTPAEAVADCSLVAVASARVGLYRDHARSPRAWAPGLLETAGSTRVAIMLGPEDKGLSNEELALGTQLIQIPTTEKFTSINLAQAVMLCCYELYVASRQFEPSTEKSPEAPSRLRELMFAAWREALLGIGFMKEDKADHMMLGLRRILSRGKLTVNDVKILMGMARQADWCAKELEKERGKDAGAAS